MISIDETLTWFRETGQSLWIFNSNAITPTDFSRFVADRDELLLAASGAEKIALCVSDPLLTVQLLLAMQGVVRQMLLMPQGTQDSQAGSFLETSDTRLLVTDDPAMEHALPAIKCINPAHAGDAGTRFDGARDLDTTWVIPTSGTTSTPKLVTHNLASLTRTVGADRQKGKAYRWGLLYEVTRFAGLQVFLQSFFGGSTLILNRPDEDLATSLLQFVDASCNALSTTPTMWRKILMLSEADKLSLKQVTLGGEIADEGLLETLGKRFPDARIVHIYASTEAGVGFSVIDGQAGFPASFLETGTPAAEVSVSEEGFLLLKPRGEKREVFLNEGEERVMDENGFINTGDLVSRQGGRFLFLGRANGAINVGGNKVYPEEVEQLLTSDPRVGLAKVEGKKSAFTGEVVVARICLTDPAVETSAVKEELLALCRENLERHKVPSIITLSDALELNASGKLKRIES